jgi:GT2 family glycosyltransferase
MYDKAIRFANGAYIALLQDDDKISDFTWIDKAIAYFHQYPDLAILGGKNGLDSKIDEQRQILEEEENKQTASKKIDFYFVHTVNRAPMFLNKDLFLKHLQHIDFSLAPFQCDDCELCLRAWVSGLKVAWYNAGFESLMAGGMRIWNNQLMNFQGRKNQKILYEKYKSHLGKILESVNKANNEIR